MLGDNCLLRLLLLSEINPRVGIKLVDHIQDQGYLRDALQDENLRAIHQIRVVKVSAASSPPLKAPTSSMTSFHAVHFASQPRLKRLRIFAVHGSYCVPLLRNGDCVHGVAHRQSMLRDPLWLSAVVKLNL